MKKKIKEIRKVMQQLGYTRTDLLKVNMLDDARAIVIYAGHIFGIYDFNRHTFID